MFDDLAGAVQTEDVNPGIVGGARPLLEAVQHHEVPLGHSPLELDVLVGVVARHLFEIGNEPFASILNVGIVLGVGVAGVALDRFAWSTLVEHQVVEGLDVLFVARGVTGHGAKRSGDRVDNRATSWHTFVVSNEVRCMVIRGGTSKGAYFSRSDLPTDTAARDDLLRRIMGSPDPRQIDGIGGAHPLTSKVAIVSPSGDPDVDLDYLFLQVGVDDGRVSDRQNCGNLLAGVGPFAIERTLVSTPGDGEVDVRIRMLNTNSIATARFTVRDGAPVYSGDTTISGVPGAAAAIHLDFEDIAGSSTGALLPTANVVDTVAGIACTLIDNGMPVVVMRADAVGVTGYESCAELEANNDLRDTLEQIRLEAGALMGLGHVRDTTVPKLTLVAEPREDGDLCTRTFIPHRCHEAIGVLGAVSVATAALLEGSPASEVFTERTSGRLRLEHPTGVFEAAVEVATDSDGTTEVVRAGIIRTARKLMDGIVFAREV